MLARQILKILATLSSSKAWRAFPLEYGCDAPFLCAGSNACPMPIQPEEVYRLIMAPFSCVAPQDETIFHGGAEELSWWTLGNETELSEQCVAAFERRGGVFICSSFDLWQGPFICIENYHPWKFFLSNSFEQKTAKMKIECTVPSKRSSLYIISLRQDTTPLVEAEGAHSTVWEDRSDKMNLSVPTPFSYLSSLHCPLRSSSIVWDGILQIFTASLLLHGRKCEGTCCHGFSFFCKAFFFPFAGKLVSF